MAQTGLEVTDLRCGNQSNPLAVEQAEFSWKLRSDAANVVQSAYELEVASTKEKLESENADVWKSGKVASSEQMGIHPKEVPLKDATPYYWRVRIWDGADRPTPWCATA